MTDTVSRRTLDALRKFPRLLRRWMNLRALGSLAFLGGFVWAALRAYGPLGGRHLPVPDLPSLAASGGDPSLASVPVYLLHEGEWAWARGGSMFVAPDSIGGLRPFEARMSKTADGSEEKADRLCQAAAWAAQWWSVQSKLLRPPQFGDGVAHTDEEYRARLRKALAERGALIGPAQTLEAGSWELEVGSEVVDILRQAASQGMSRLASPEEVWRRFGMEYPPLEAIPSQSKDRPMSVAERSAALHEALRQHGPMLAIISDTVEARAPAEQSHPVYAGLLIGEYEFEDGQLFLLRIPGGLAGQGKKRDSEFVVARTKAILAAWSFPHAYQTEMRPAGNGGALLTARDSWGRALRLRLPGDLRMNFDGLAHSPRPGEYRIEPAAGRAAPGSVVTVAGLFYVPPSGPRTIPLPVIEDAPTTASRNEASLEGASSEGYAS